MDFETIQLEIGDDGVAVLTLHRPDRMNAFTTHMMHDILGALEQTAADPKVRALIFTGSGERAFCAGADLQAGADTFNYRTRSRTTGKPDDGRDGGGKVSLALFDYPKPVIGAFNGVAVGVGVTMTLPMDIRLAADHARFGFVFARRGIVPEAASSWFLPRLVGISRALEWCYSGRVFAAEEALEAGLVSQVLPADKLMGEARRIAGEIASECAPMSITMTRQMLWKMLGADHPMEAHKVDSRAIRATGRSADAAEGINSFLEKRKPNFSANIPDDLPDFYPWWKDRDFE